MLKIVDSSTLRNHLRDVLEEISKKKDYVLIMRKSKPIGAIVNLDFLEDLLALTSSQYLESIRQAREDYRKGRSYSHADLFGKIE